jgi:hypothetical protein
MSEYNEWEDVFKEELEVYLTHEDAQLECVECDVQWPTNAGALFVPIVLGVHCFECFGIPGSNGFDEEVVA